MRTLRAAFPVMLCLLLPSIAGAEWPRFPFVHAVGEASLEVPPDEATISFTVATFNAESAPGMEVLQDQVRKALAVLANANVPAEAITGFDLQKTVERAYDDDYNELEILGYHFSRNFEVELSDLEKFRPLVAELMAVDNVFPIDAEFDVGNRDEIESKLVQQAGEDARRRADELARSMGASIDSVLAISESPLESVRQKFEVSGDEYRALVMTASRRGRGQETIFIPDVVEVHKTVDVLFKLRSND